MKCINRNDYKPYPFILESVILEFDIDPEITTVHSTFTVIKKGDHENMILNGEHLELLNILINGNRLTTNQYILNDNELIIINPPFYKFILEIFSRNKPNKNYAMSGLYISSSKTFITQCEPEGFRRICWFPDRPDVMSIYTVIIKTDANYNTVLSNGNLIKSELISNGKRQTIWYDPFPKPCYLFAMVIGNLACKEKNIITKSGRKVILKAYTEEYLIDNTDWALESLLHAITWDEKVYNLELDLNVFMIVATKDFNMGAMENKGLNIFNTSYILANQKTSSDKDYINILSVVGHEYFHNWTGNRVTCRDWFQLSLKEGLTVFREQEFITDMMSINLKNNLKYSAKAVKRIDDVIYLREHQFPEDSGPMAHSIRPESYQEISNFYTSTIYEKGAEIIRMQYRILGKNNFFKGMNEYFRKYDGCAVSCEDFMEIMENIYHEENKNNNLKMFRNWYSQAGTPTIKVNLSYNEEDKTCKISLEQYCDPVGLEKTVKDFIKRPFYVPFAIGLIDETGKSINIDKMENYDNTSIDGNTITLNLIKEKDTWIFKNIQKKPIPSLLRDFSAPVIVDYNYSEEELLILLMNDENYFSKWEAAQELAIRYILEIYNKNSCFISLKQEYILALKNIVESNEINNAYKSKILDIPTEKNISERLKIVDPVRLTISRDIFIKEIGKKLFDNFINLLSVNYNEKNFKFSFIETGKRNFRNLSLNYILSTGSYTAQQIAISQYYNSSNITNRISALSSIENLCSPKISNDLLEDFFITYKNNHTLIDKWFSIQASSKNRNIEHINNLIVHHDFNIYNPNRVRSLIFQFCMNNIKEFHNSNGLSYNFWANKVIELDNINPELASNLARAMDKWSCFIPNLRKMMEIAICKVRNHNNISRNVSEVISKILDLSR